MCIVYVVVEVLCNIIINTVLAVYGLVFSGRHVGKLFIGKFVAVDCYEHAQPLFVHNLLTTSSMKSPFIQGCLGTF